MCTVTLLTTGFWAASQCLHVVRVSANSDPFFKGVVGGKAQSIMTRSYLLIAGAGSAQENSKLSILPNACTVGPNLQSHAKTPQLMTSVDPATYSPGALRSLFELRGYQFVPVPQDGNRRGHATPAPASVLHAFSLEELLDHVLDLVNASRSKEPEKLIVFGDVRVDLAKMEVIRVGREVVLTAQEFKTLAS